MSKLNLDHHHHEEDHHEEECFSFVPATIFDLQREDEDIPKGFDAVKICIDGTLKADLSWKFAQIAAEKYLKLGYRLFWEIDLGLFHSLPKPVTDQSQFLSLSLSLKQFQDTLWKEFGSKSIGICLYRGSLDFSQEIKKDETLNKSWQEWQKLFTHHEKEDLYRLFCRDVAADYLNLLKSQLLDSIPCFVLLDATGVIHPLHVAKLLTKEKFPRICLGVKGARGLGGDLAWDDPSQPSTMGFLSRKIVENKEKEKIRIGISFPCCDPDRKENEALGELLSEFLAAQLRFKVIPENLLTSEWDGLDFLVVQSEGISPEVMRSLRGFCAAGGMVVVAGKTLELHNEISFEDWRIHGYCN